MYASKIQRKLREKGRLFDTETGGVFRGQGVFSYAYMGYGENEPVNRYVSSPDQKGWSLFSKDLYEKTLPNIKSGETFSAADFKKGLSTDIVDYLDKGGRLVGHNIGFDISAVGQEFEKDSVIYDKLYNALGLDRSQQLAEAAVPKHVRQLMHQKEFTKAFHAYGAHIENGGKLVDTLSLTQMMLGMAEERRHVDLKGDIWSGTKLEVLNYALGGKEQIHEAGEDIKLMGERVNDFLFNTLSYLERGSYLPEENKSVLKFLENIRGTKEAPGIIDHQLRRTLAEMAMVHNETGKFYVGTELWNPENETDLINRGKLHREVKGERYLVDTWEEVMAEHKSFESERIYKKVYGYSDQDFSRIFDEYKTQFSGKTEQQVFDEFSGMFSGKALRENILGKVKDFKPVTKAFNAGESFGRALMSKRTLGWAAAGVGAVALATGYAALTRGYDAPAPHGISGKDDDYNTLEGLHPGGGVNKANIQEMTDFGSGFRGFLNKGFEFVSKTFTNAPEIAKRAVTGLAKEVAEHPGVTLGGAAIGLYQGYNKGKDEGHVKVGSFARNIALDMLDDVVIFGAPAILGESVKNNAAFNAVSKVLESKPARLGAVGFFGYTMGKLAGEFIGSRFSGKDDFYNTIEGLHVGAGPMSVGRSKTHSMTDFGSGYKGPNPQLNPEYNEAEDIPRYQMVRASKIGLSEDELYKWMTRPDKDASEYVMASASAGTALHQYFQAQEAAQGNLIAQEELVVNRAHGITGHVDVIKKGLGPGDIKTVNNGIYNAILKEGKPKPMHRDQVMFYLGQTGYEQGFIQYVNRDNIRQQKTYTVNFNPYEYEKLLGKVERARTRVENDIARGILSKSSLPKTASIETLEAYQEDEHETLEQAALGLDEKRRMFYEEMSYLRSIKRGMPTSGPGAQRIHDRHREKREGAMMSTQGIGLQIWNNHNKHHYM